jgi:hypothetical protein
VLPVVHRAKMATTQTITIKPVATEATLDPAADADTTDGAHSHWWRTAALLFCGYASYSMLRKGWST